MNSNYWWLAVLVVAAILWFRTPASADPAAAHAKIKNGARVVDVRTPAEFDAGHWPDAVNIPLNEVPQRLKEFGPTNQPVVVYCRSGNRSGRAQKILKEAGYTDVTNGGGLAELQKTKP